MYKAMQSMLMKTSAPSFSPAFLFLLFFMLFSLLYFLYHNNNTKKIFFSDTRKKFSQVSDISKENAVDLKGFRLVRVIEQI